MRVSKAPEERRREMIDTAMELFARKGYEATTMTDIAKEMNVVSGLCYRYFASKEQLYQEALDSYARECAAPIIAILQTEHGSYKEYMTELQKSFLMTDGKERYHEFFHRAENDWFHNQLEHSMLKILTPYIVAFLKKMKERGEIQVKDYEAAAVFILYGEMPIINDDTLTTEEKIARVSAIIYKILM